MLRIIYKNGKENLCCIDLHSAGKVFNVYALQKVYPTNFNSMSICLYIVCVYAIYVHLVEVVFVRLHNLLSEVTKVQLILLGKDGGDYMVLDALQQVVEQHGNT